MQFPFVRTVLASAVAVVSSLAQAQQVAALPSVTITGNYDNAIGTSDVASEGVVTSKLLASRPTLRPAEVLEFVPGVIVSQHSGDGKANQYYLRGFNLDHGTDFATTVDGMPVNMPTHAHGQGYSDLNWLIPELVDRISYRKGPYYASEGDFASAGAAHIQLFNGLPRGLASLTAGENGYARALLVNTTPLTTGKLLYAIEAAHNDGPWDNPENFRRANGVLRYSFGEGDTRSTLTGMAYTAKWRATDQVPQRAVDSGAIGRFAAVDASDHGDTSRFSLSYDLLHALDDGEFKLNAYAIQSSLDLFSNFTYFLDDPVHGDQFEQSESRQVYGLNTSRSWQTTLAGHDSTHTVGLQLRHDRLSPVGLYAAENGQRLSTTQESRVKQTSVGLYASNETRWQPWLRSVAGIRTDQYHVDVNSSIAGNSGRQTALINSPKLTLIFGPWDKTEYFFSYGYGFHSNDARGVTATISPKQGTPIEPSPALVRTKGAELGLRTEIVPGLQSSLSLWQLTLGSELVFSGDAGDTEASGASKRYGIEFNNHYVANSWLLLDADLAFSQSRFKEEQGDAPNAGRYIPGSVRTVASLGATVTGWGPWFGQFQLRYFGPRPLIEDNSQRSRGTTLAYARVGYKVSPDVKLSLDVFNLFDRKASDIDYYYTSRLQGEAAQGVGDLHSHPAEPRTVRVTMNVSF
ncbi:TonB-denpendent receptor [Aquabacterium sp. NJ1]|uniref:TonB-dependent receptor n=1 Tax=Aquabacterium sp. NJ1 TaxID=1538295 RepID=UPI00052CF126|nr:TonB-dependent receptor [Aquabacterium sp. NJ1]KGM39674.1 TonB-denpendent receptor [Aquabacterium sp. NJ1]